MTGPKRNRSTLAATLALVSLGGFSLAARAQDAPPPAGNAAPPVVEPSPAPGNDAPPARQPAYPPPPPQAYPPGYGPPSYPPGYPPPGAGYPPGYPPPGYGGYRPPVYLPPPPPTHEGLYVRLHLGGGFTSISESIGSGGSVTFSGGSVSLGVSVGGAVAPNLAIFGTAFGSLVGTPNVKVSGYGYDATGSSNGDIGIAGVGAGVVYYFEPVNIYLSGVIAAMNVQADDSNGDTSYTSKFGPGFEGIIGKEWWVSQHWGLGVAGEFLAATMKDKTTSTDTWNAAGFNLLFSATCF
jgi:hypothetical protein